MDISPVQSTETNNIINFGVKFTGTEMCFLYFLGNNCNESNKVKIGSIGTLEMTDYDL